MPEFIAQVYRVLKCGPPQYSLYHELSGQYSQFRIYCLHGTVDRDRHLLVVWIFFLVVLVLARKSMPLLDGVQDSSPRTQGTGRCN